MASKLFTKSAPFLAFLGLALTGCQPDLEQDIKPSSGTADFSRYIAVGNSLTAGQADGGLYLEGQLNSYPNLLAQQFRSVGGGEFVQPLFTEAQRNGTGYLRLAGFTATGSPITAPVNTELALRAGATAARPLYTKFTEPINNLGVPGIRMADILSTTYGSVTGNPLFERITPDAQSNQTYLARVAASNPTFFTAWMGNNDVLGYATSGGASTAPTSSLTTTATFTANNNQLIDALTANGAKGIVATIPDVTNIPFFTTVGPSFRATLETPQPGLPTGVPGLVIQTGSATGPASATTRKQIATADIRNASGVGRQLFTLTSSPFLGLLNQRTGRAWRYIYGQSGQPAAGFPLFLTAYGIDTLQTFGTSMGNPIPSAFVLDDAEQTLVRNATTAFNNAMIAKANAKGLAVFDVNGFFARVATNGIITNGVNNTAQFITGNLFSLDGVHLTPRGYSIVANEMIRLINQQYGASVPTLNSNEYPGVKFP